MSAIETGTEDDQVIASGIPADGATACARIGALSRAIALEALEAKALVGQLKGNKAFIGQASRDYTGRFVFELLQNAYDAHPRGAVGEVRILLDETVGEHGVLYVANSGKPFSGEDVRAISEIAQSSKAPGEGIGNKGVGFKSVLEVCQWPEIYSASIAPSGEQFDGYCFGFAQAADMIRLVGGDETKAAILDERMSAYALPVVAPDQDDNVRAFARDGMSTVIRLPLRSATGRQRASDQIRESLASTAPILLFLDRIAALRLEVRGPDPLSEVLVRRVTGRLGPDGIDLSTIDLGSSGQYLLATRPVPHRQFIEAIRESVEAHTIDPEWLSWKQDVSVAVAVRTDSPLDAGRLYCFLPMDTPAAAPAAAHFNAPFAVRLARDGLVQSAPLNSLLLSALAHCCVSVALYLRDENNAKGLVVDLVAWSSDSLPTLRTAFEQQGAKLEDSSVVPVLGDSAWSSLTSSYYWDEASSVVLTCERIALATKSPILDPSIGPGRVGRVRTLHRDVLRTPMDPQLPGIARWTEAVAELLRKEQSGTTRRFEPYVWLAFYDEIARLFANSGGLLAGRAILIDDSTELRPCWGGDVGSGKANAAVFFQARSDDGDEDADVAIDRSIPQSLRKYIAYMHRDLDWHVLGSQGRPENRLGRRFLETANLVRPYRKQGLFERLHDVLPRATSNRVRADALRLVFNLDASGRYSGKPDVADLGLRVPAQNGNWIPAGQARFSEAWPGTEGPRLARLIAGVGHMSPELGRLANSMLLPPSDWDLRVDPQKWVPFLRRIGVKDGLWPLRVAEVGEHSGVNWSAETFATWASLNEQDKKTWIPAAKLADRPYLHPYTPYQSEHTVRIPGQSEFDILDRPSRELFAALIASGLATWPSSLESFAVRRPHHPGAPDEHRWPSPAWAFLTSAAWVPVSRPGEAGEADLVPPALVWRYQDDGEAQPLFAPLLAGPLRNRASEDAVVRARLSRLGVQIWSDVAGSAGRLVLLADLLDAGAVAESQLATFRKAYERSWRQVTDAGADAPWATETDVRLVVSRHGRLATYQPSSDNERLYVLGEPDRLSETLLGSLDYPVLRVEAEVGVAAAATLRRFMGERLRVVRSGDFRVFLGVAEVGVTPDLPLLVGPENEWLVDLVALTLEIKSTQMNRQTAQTVRAAIEKLRRIRIQSGTDLRIELDGGYVPVPVFLSQAVPVPDEEQPVVAYVESSELGTWQTLGQIAQSVADLLRQSWAGPHLQLALQTLARRGGNDRVFVPDDDDYSAALNEAPDRIREIRGELRGVSDELLYWLRPVTHYFTGLDLLTGDGSDASKTVEEKLRQSEAELPEGVTVDRLIIAARQANSMPQLRDSLGLDFRLFNKSLASLGRTYHPIHNEDGQASAFSTRLGERRLGVIDGLRALHLDGYDLGEDVPGFAVAIGEITRVLMRRPRTASSVLELGPDPAWIEDFELPPDALIDERIDAWLLVQGADAHALVDLPPYDEVSAANRAVVARFVAQASPLVAAWAGKHAEVALPEWSHPSGSMDLVERLATTGRLGFRALNGDDLISQLASWGEWPAGMPPSLDLVDLNLLPIDLSQQATADERGRWLREQERKSVLLDGKRVSLETSDLETLVALVKGGLSSDLLATPARVTDLGVLGSVHRKRSGSGSHSSFRAGRLPEAKAEIVGFIGELIAYEWIRANFALSGPECWVSANRRFVFPEDGGDDSLGYDFKVSRRRGGPICFEVKSSSAADALSFELTEPEVVAAQERSGSDTYRIVFIADVLNSSARTLHVLPNPLDPKSQGRYRVVGTGIRYAFKLEES